MFKAGCAHRDGSERSSSANFSFWTCCTYGYKVRLGHIARLRMRDRRRTEIKGHAEVGQAGSGKDHYRNLVKESDASRSLRVEKRMRWSAFGCFDAALCCCVGKSVRARLTMRSSAIVASSAVIMQTKPTQNQL